jgi:hypothetical protein
MEEKLWRLFQVLLRTQLCTETNAGVLSRLELFERQPAGKRVQFRVVQHSGLTEDFFAVPLLLQKIRVRAPVQGY